MHWLCISCVWIVRPFSRPIFRAAAYLEKKPRTSSSLSSGAYGWSRDRRSTAGNQSTGRTPFCWFRTCCPIMRFVQDFQSFEETKRHFLGRFLNITCQGAPSLPSVEQISLHSPLLSTVRKAQNDSKIPSKNPLNPAFPPLIPAKGPISCIRINLFSHLRRFEDGKLQDVDGNERA